MLPESRKVSLHFSPMMFNLRTRASPSIRLLTLKPQTFVQVKNADTKNQKRQIIKIFSFIFQIILLVKALDAYNITYFTVTAQIVSHVLAYMNSCVNPVLYAFLSENFRVAFRKVRMEIALSLAYFFFDSNTSRVDSSREKKRKKYFTFKHRLTKLIIIYR